MTYCRPAINIGDIVLCEVTYTDYSSSKIRPVLIISTRDYDLGADDIIIAAVTSQIDPASPYKLILDDADPAFTDTGLKRKSAVDCTKILTISYTLLARRLGRLSTDQLNSVHTILRTVLDL